MKALHTIAFILVVVGGLNWLIFGIWGTDLGEWIGGMSTVQSKIVYILVGLSAIYLIATHKKDCKCCTSSNGGGQAM